MDDGGNEGEGIGWRLRRAISDRGWKTVAAFHEEQGLELAGVKYKTLSSNIKDNKVPRPAALKAIASALGLDPSAFHLASDEDFLAVLDRTGPTAPDPEPPEEPSRKKEHSSGIERSVEVVGHVGGNGVIRGSIAIDSTPLPVPPSLLKKQHAKLHAPDEVVETRSVEAVPIDCQIMIADEAIELRDQNETIYPGHYLIVTTKRDARAGKLVLARKVVEIDEFRRVATRASLPANPETKLFRYLPDDDGDWRLKPIDGTKKSFGSGDWEIVASVLWWRPP